MELIDTNAAFWEVRKAAQQGADGCRDTDAAWMDAWRSFKTIIELCDFYMAAVPSNECPECGRLLMPKRCEHCHGEMEG